MAFTIEGYTINELIKLGKQVEVVGKVNISGDAKTVGQTFIALGLFAPIASELKRLTDGNLISSDDELEEVEDEEKKEEFIAANWPNDARGQCTFPLPKLNFVNAKDWLPSDSQPGSIERRYLVKWNGVNNTGGEAICFFDKGTFWTCGSGVIAKLDVLNKKMLVEWAPLY